MLGRFPYELSGGECQRVAIARAIIMAPPLLLADEPTGALDEGTGRQIMRLLGKLNEKGMTMIIATHDRGIADSCDKILYMRDGQIEREE